MTPDPHEAFRRPRGPGAQDDVAGESSSPPAGTAHAVGDAAPVILDTEFHQSVWKPWQEPHQLSPEDAHAPERVSARARRRVRVTWLFGVSAVVVVALVAAFLLPPLLERSTWRAQPFVADMKTKPGIAWSTEGGQRCWEAPDDDHAILSDSTSVRSLDLRDGSTLWKKELTGSWGYLVCAPEADVVAISEVDESGEVLRIKMLRSSTGVELAELNGDSTAQVVALGPHVGLLDKNNTLTAVAPERPDAPVWTHLLPGPVDDIGTIFTHSVDATTTELSYALESESSLGALHTFGVFLVNADGQTPGWARGSATDRHYFQRAGDVVIRFVFADDSESVEATDLEGNDLWSSDSGYAFVQGSRLFMASTPRPSDLGYSELKEIDPRTGWPVNDAVYEEPFNLAEEGPDGYVTVWREDSMVFLDENLQPQPSMTAQGNTGRYLGQKWLYLSDDMYEGSPASQTRLTAINPAGARTLWTMELEPGQRVEQWGQHLVITSKDGLTIQGLGNM